MPDMTGGLATMAVTSAVVAGAAFGLATPSHAAEPKAPTSAAHGAHEAADTATLVRPVADRQNQGHY